jgi:hypothetical protein
MTVLHRSAATYKAKAVRERESLEGAREKMNGWRQAHKAKPSGIIWTDGGYVQARPRLDAEAAESERKARLEKHKDVVARLGLPAKT